MIQLLKFLFTIIIVTIYLVGCGFTPRNIKSLPPALKQVYYQAEHAYEPLEIKLKKRLKSCGIVLRSIPQKSSPIINITSNYSHSTYTNISSAQARTYTLVYTATIGITDFYHQTLLPPQVITVTRTISLQPNEIFELTPQIGITKQEIVEELVMKIFNVLGSHQTVKALKPKTHENSN
ncbi:MAG: hypothetical protein LBL17_02685 [Coxiellaceae bacterium]|jgi:outer membrane lipopolysaccharide assembly protein LptE/RlpB|nr:hypothetical protein [Coxiellaceae bacterium]